VRVKAAGRQPSPSSGRGFRNGGNAARPATFRDAQAGTFRPPGALVNSPRPSTYCSYAKHNQDGKGSRRRQSGSSVSAVQIERTAHPVRKVAFPQIRDEVWSGTGSNCRPSAFRRNPIAPECGWMSPDGPSTCTDRRWASPCVARSLPALAPCLAPRSDPARGCFAVHPIMRESPCLAPGSTT
jgi:hypothetical protein